MKKLFLSILFFMMFVNLKGQMQPGTTFQNIIDVAPKSPELASLGKFGEIPVSYSTGIPDISIPVYEITIGNIKLPLTLSYHAGGIRIDETSSSAGTGWALSGIGAVSRQMLGIPDESQYGFKNAPSPDSVDASPATFYQYLYDVQKGLKDAEPDIYSYNINGESGKFIYRRNGAFMQIPITNNKIEWLVGGSGGYFKITDDDGIIYLFEKPMQTDLAVASGLGSYVSSWRLTKMVDSNSSDTIFFSYESTCNASYQQSRNFTHFIGNMFTACTATAPSQFKSEEEFKSQSITLYEAYPKEIRWRGGQISFVNACDRTDVTGSGMRLSEVLVYSNLNGKLKLVKRMKLYHSYFNSTGSGYAFTNATNEQKKRLRLDSVALLSNSGSLSPQTYRMVYDTSQLAPRESYAQDRWGFNNGAWGNYSLMPAQNIYFYNTYYNIGSANRNADSTRMIAGTIKSIEYPTKGRTVFEFEPHSYNKQVDQTQDYYILASCTGSVQSSTSQTFTVAANDENFQYSLSISAFSAGNVTDRPRITLTDQTTGSQYFMIATPPGQEAYPYQENNVALSLTAGHTYVLQVNIYSTSPEVSAYCQISYKKNLGQATIAEKGAGLRVKTITNFDFNGRFIDKERYEYAPAVMLTDHYYQDLNYEQVMPRGGAANCSYRTNYVPPIDALIFHANSVLPVSQFNGSPLLYPIVTKYDVDSLGNTNGKTEYSYKIYTDQPEIANLNVTSQIVFNNIGIVLASNYWKNNNLTDENIYKGQNGNYKLIHSKHYEYNLFRETYETSLKIKNKYLTICCQEVNSTSIAATQDFVLNPVPNRTGKMLLSSESDTTWDDYGNKLYKSIEYEYEDMLHTLPTLKRSFTSTGEVIIERNTYPSGLAVSGNVFQKMVNRNMLSPVVRSTKEVSGKQVSLMNVNYNDWNNNSRLLLPQTVEQQLSNNPVDVKVRFNKFDIYGNVLEQQKENDISQSYIWGYDTLLPIATVSNAIQTDVAYTSFEPDANGNWTIASATRDTTQSVTGRQCYSLSGGSISRSGLSAGKSFIVSYWTKSGSATVNSTSGTLVMSKNGWNYYEHKLNTGISTVTVSGSVIIDELRVYPSDAQMITYSYDPEIGIINQCDANNKITYYEYDGFNRLKLARDMDRNIITTYDYRYKQ